MNWLRKFFKVLTLGIGLNLVLGVTPSFADAVTYLESYTNSVNGVTGLQGISDVAVSPDGKFVYTASYQSSAVSVFERNPETGQLTYRSTKTGLSAAFSVDVSSDNKNVYVASPTGSVVIALSRDITTGALTETNRLGGSPTGGFVSVSTSPDAKTVYGIGGSPSGLVVFNSDANTGSITRLADYADNVGGNALGQVFSPTGSPIKNIASSADGNFVYVTSTTDNAVSLFSRDTTTGALTLVSVYTDNVASVDGLQAASSAKLSPDGKNLYVTGQGESSVAIFSVDSRSGELTYLAKVTHGVDGVTNMQGARSLAISPDGKYVLVSAISSSSVTAFLRDSTTGLLTFDSEVVNSVNGVTNFSAPSGMSTDPLNRHLYVAAQNSASLVVFSLPTPAVKLSVTSQTATVSGPAVVLDNQLAVLDSDSLDLVSAQISISSGFIATDTLAVQTVVGIAASYDSATGVLSLSGVASLADYQTVLRSLTYQAGADPSLNTGDSSERTISIVVSDGDNSSATSSLVVTVEKADLYTVSFVDWDNTVLSTQQVGAGSAATAPTSPTRTGYSFTGWSVPFDNISSALTVQAQYSINSYTITFDSAGGSAVAPITANYGAAVTAPANPVRAGYTFTGWNPAVPATMPAQNMTLTAVYGQGQFTVAATVTGAATISPATQQVSYGSTASFTLNLNNPDDVVILSGTCQAALSGNQIVTAVITESCEVQVTVYPSTDVEKDSSTALTANGVARFSFSGGAGTKVISGAGVMRSGALSELSDENVQRLLTKQADGSYLFSSSRTGRYTFEFIDAVSGELVQVTFDVLPYLAFTSSQQPVQRDVATNVRVWLSDEPVEYPVTVAVVKDGVTAEVQTIEFTAEHKLLRTYAVTATAATARLILQEAGISNALLGTPALHNLAIQQQTPALALTAKAAQNANETYVVSQTDGVVTLSVSELNATEATYTWTASGITLNASGATASFDPSTLAEGRYTITVTALSANGRAGQYDLALRVIADCPVESCAGAGSSGIPASANNFAATQNRLPLCPNVAEENRVGSCQVEGSQALYAEVPNQYQLTLGALTEEQSWSSGQFGIALNDRTLADAGFVQQGLVVNFDVLGLENPGEVVPVAIPLSAGTSIPAKAVWRKFINGQWQNFVVDSANRIDSAARDVLGQCPGVSSNLWVSGLTTGHGCVRLTIQDGGPNDDDGIANSVIRDPGVLAVAEVVLPPAPVPVPPKDVAAKSGGSMGSVLSVLLGGIAAFRMRKLVFAAATLVPLSVSAQDLYLGADFMSVNSDTSSTEITRAMNAKGVAGTAVIDNQSRTGFRLYGGHQFAETLSIEFGWLDTGEVTTLFSDVAPDTVASDLETVWPASGEGLELSLLWQPAAQADFFKPGVRLGVWQMEAKDRFFDAADLSRQSQSETVPFAELQGQFVLSEDWSLKLGVSYYNLDSADIRTAQLGLIRHF
jgi:6-phosphogluconolactonase (cycloisomerase 2 family)